MTIGRLAFLPLLISLQLAYPAVVSTAAAQSGAGQSAVILNYQRFDETRYPETSVPASQFDNQVATLAGGRYNVVPVRDIVDALFAGTALPNRTVAITVDDAYSSFYRVGWPRLKQAGLPVTLFVYTDAIDAGGPAFMTWDQIRELKASGVTIGAHGAAHTHLVAMTLEQVRADIDRAARRIAQELGEPPILFSYPYGEMSSTVRGAISEAGFVAAFGQHSGAANGTLDRYFLPRFSINGKYGTKSEFRKRIDSLGLPLRDVSPSDPYMAGEAPPTVVLALDDSLDRVTRLHCFHSTSGDDFVEIEPSELDGRRYELRFGNAFPPGPWRLNCTLATGGSRIRWWGMQFHSAG